MKLALSIKFVVFAVSSVMLLSPALTFAKTTSTDAVSASASSAMASTSASHAKVTKTKKAAPKKVAPKKIVKKAKTTSSSAAVTTSTSKPANSGVSGSSDNTDSLGATAVCNDGLYSHSATHEGSCSGHGGVKQFLK